MMILEDDAAHELKLTDDDFPSNFLYMHHPEDYIITPTPVTPQMIYHNPDFAHKRLILRISWKVGESKYMPMSFVCDTGAPGFLYIGNNAGRNILQSHAIIKTGEMDILFATIEGEKVMVREVPVQHHPANIMGLTLLKKWGLSLDPKNNSTFKFSNLPSFLG